MKKFEAFLRRALPFGVALLVAGAYLNPSLAAAQGASETIGAKIQFATNNMVGPLLFIVSLSCALGGVFLFAKGLLKLKDSHQDQNAFKSAFTSLVAATILIALPEAAGIGMNTVMGTQGMMFRTSEMRLASDALDGAGAIGQSQSMSQGAVSLAEVGGVKPCIGSDGMSTAVPCMAENLAKNVVPIGIIAVFAFIYLWGLWGLGSSLFELARHSAERGGGSPQGFWLKALTSVLAMSMPTLFMAVSRTITGSEGNITEIGLSKSSEWLTYSVTGANILQQYAQMITYTFHILALFGVIAFAKGLFILKGVGEQRQSATFSHGIVFMIAGVLLANAKLSTCTIMGTLSGFSAAASVGFCG
jgi:hypothetical protein